MEVLSANSKIDNVNTIVEPNIDQSVYDEAESKSKQKSMAEKLLEDSEERINRNIKDSVFCNLFGDQDYLFQLYQALHPEDHETESEDLTLVTLSRIIVHEMYNDLGFLAGNRLIVLVEAQSSWSENIVVRFLLYLAETYRRYINRNGFNLYTTKKVVLPKPELFVVYTGERGDKPEKISLKECFFGVDSCCIDVEATVIYDSKAGDIINQYIVFSKVFDEQRKQYPEELKKSVQETIRICKEKNVLADYLAKEEVAVVMYNFADQEREFKKALEEEFLQGKEEGIAEERENTRKEAERADIAEQRAKEERQRAEEERQRAEEERKRTEEERKRTEEERRKAVRLEKELREIKMKLEELNKIQQDR